jgi:RimJ/RimL family protein N-acetyltransferase
MWEPAWVSAVRWDGTPVLLTPRLVLRTFRRDDLPAYAALNADPRVYRYLDGVPMPAKESEELAGWANECHETEGIGMLAVERRSDGAFLGQCGLHHQESYPDELEVAWRFGSQHWRNGYATEAATAWVDHAFTDLRSDRVISMTDRDNARSLAVMRRLGMALDHEAQITDNGQVFDAIVYAVSRQEWLARR